MLRKADSTKIYLYKLGYMCLGALNNSKRKERTVL